MFDAVFHLLQWRITISRSTQFLFIQRMQNNVFHSKQSRMYIKSTAFENNLKLTIRIQLDASISITFTSPFEINIIARLLRLASAVQIARSNFTPPPQTAILATEIGKPSRGTASRGPRAIRRAARLFSRGRAPAASSPLSRRTDAEPSLQMATLVSEAASYIGLPARIRSIRAKLNAAPRWVLRDEYWGFEREGFGRGEDLAVILARFLERAGRDYGYAFERTIWVIVVEQAGWWTTCLVLRNRYIWM